MRDMKQMILNQAPDVGQDFKEYGNTHFNMAALTSFLNQEGQIRWDRCQRKYRMSFNCLTAPFERAKPWEFPAEYERDETGGFGIEFVSERTVRIRMDATHSRLGGGKWDEREDLMIPGKLALDESWKRREDEASVKFSGSLYDVYLEKSPFNIQIKDKMGKTIVSTYNIVDNKALDNTYPIPFSYVRRREDLRRKVAASFHLKHDEKIYGCGESFTRLDKRGQRLNLWTYDALGVQSRDMYKPVPFFMSSEGYGMFPHGSCAMTFDFGHDYDEAATLYLDDDQLDLYIFLGSPQEILTEYTAITGRAQMPPDWSFGLWMGRITYDNEAQIREVAGKFRTYRIPCDVIHLDTGWFEDDWKCNYRFAASRFVDAEKMVKDLKEEGFRLSLWQIPYITPTNELYEEACRKGYFVRDSDGKIPTEDLIIDFSNERAVKWYQGLLKNLLDMGIGAIKVDFGEGAPAKGQYASGKSGRYEHNLYPLRYNKVVDEITGQCTGEHIIWARSAWAGSQRYPIHWSGDAEITDSAMAATLRGGLSLGLCGFTFWSHDIGGFTKKSPEELYMRWLPFGMLTSHSRCHGQPPKEPWEYSEALVSVFRKSVELKYRLFPYIKKEAEESVKRGFPMLRTMFFEYPKDPIAWNIEDQYFFGRELLVAPLFEENQSSRAVYLPEGEWVDFFSREVHGGGKYITMQATELPIVLLVRRGSQIAMAPLAQCMDEIDWSAVWEEKF